MTATQAVGIAQAEDVLDVLLTVPARELGLAAVKDGAAHGAVADRQTGDLADALCQQAALVVAALPFATPR